MIGTLHRADAATSAMLASAKNATVADPKGVNLAPMSVIFGAVRHAFERDLPPSVARGLPRQLVLTCRSCLDAPWSALR